MMLELRDLIVTRLSASANVVRRVIGAPDYEAYVAHLRTCHPEAEPVSRDTFVRERMEARYSKPGSRCC
jgi:uncharacterized short protein YbdD (DUF466 family)